MIKFKALRENVNEALKNPYKGKPERDLKRKLASFESQLQDLIKKSKGRQRKEIEGEIRDMETMVRQVRAALGLKEDVNEAVNKSTSIYKEYMQLKKMSIKDLRKTLEQSSRGPINTKGLDKEGLISDILYGKHGKKRVQQTFGEETIEEAFSSFAVPIPSQTLNGKKIGGGKTPIIVKARTAREAIQKAAKQLGVDFKFLKTGKVTKA